MIASSVGQRPDLDVDPLVLLDLGPLDVRQPGREEHVDRLVGEARARCRSVPSGSQCSARLADLLRQLALGASPAAPRPRRRACRPGARAGRARRPPRAAGARARAARRRGTTTPTAPGWLHDLALDLRAVLVAEALLADGEDLALVARSRPDALEARAHARGRLVEQRERDVEHPLERRDRHALGRLVVALGAVGEVHAREAGGLERVRVRAAAGDDAAAARSRRRAAPPRPPRPPARSACCR